MTVHLPAALGGPAMKRLTREQRSASIVDAARDLSFEGGFESVTMQGLATRCGITRQTLYQYFHSLDDVFDALFFRVFAEVILNWAPFTVIDEAFYRRVVSRVDFFWQIDPSIHRVVASTIFAEPHGEHARLKMRKRFSDQIDSNWIDPLVKIGFEREVAYSSVYAILGVTLHLRFLIDDGAVSLARARERVLTIVRALIPSSTTEPVRYSAADVSAVGWIANSASLSPPVA
jgi:AcrR family transcriptional regulator